MAIIDRAKDVSYICKYQVASLIFMMDDTKISLGHENIMSIEKLDDYEFNIRSILKLTLRIDIRKKMWLIKNRTKIKCKFEFDMFGIDHDSESTATDPVNMFNALFGIYFNDDDEATDTDSLESMFDAMNGEMDYNDLEDEGYFSSENLFDVYLFNTELMTASNKMYNRVFTKAPLQEKIAHLLTTTKHKRVLMSPIENTEIYQEQLVPPDKAYRGLIWLDEDRGLYKKGAIIYYDTDILYIINPNGKCTAKQKDEWTETTFLVTARGTTAPGNGMVRKNGEKVFYIDVPEENVSPQKPSAAKSVQEGSAAKIIISDSTEIETVEADQTYMNERNSSITYIKKDSNKYIASMVKARMEENEAIMYIVAEGLDMHAFTPNKVYQMVFEETSKQKKYGKYKYRIAYAYHYITAESGEQMSSHHRIILKRAK